VVKIEDKGITLSALPATVRGFVVRDPLPRQGDPPRFRRRVARWCDTTGLALAIVSAHASLLGLILDRIGHLALGASLLFGVPLFSLTASFLVGRVGDTLTLQIAGFPVRRTGGARVLHAFFAGPFPIGTTLVKKGGALCLAHRPCNALGRLPLQLEPVWPCGWDGRLAPHAAASQTQMEAQGYPEDAYETSMSCAVRAVLEARARIVILLNYIRQAPLISGACQSSRGPALRIKPYALHLRLRSAGRRGSLPRTPHL